MKKIIGSFIALVLLVVTFAVVQNISYTSNQDSLPEATADVKVSQSIVDKINSAESIHLKKKALTFREDWTISADGVEVAHIEGGTFKVLDTYTSTTVDGENLIGYMTEDNRLLGRSAEVYDYNADYTGYIDWEYSMFIRMSLYDDEDEVVGDIQSEFSMGLKADMKDVEGDTSWNLERKVMSFGADITLTAGDTDSISGVDAIWMTILVSNLFDEEQSDN